MRWWFNSIKASPLLPLSTPQDSSAPNNTPSFPTMKATYFSAAALVALTSAAPVKRTEAKGPTDGTLGLSLHYCLIQYTDTPTQPRSSTTPSPSSTLKTTSIAKASRTLPLTTSRRPASTAKHTLASRPSQSMKRHTSSSSPAHSRPQTPHPSQSAHMRSASRM